MIQLSEIQFLSQFRQWSAELAQANPDLDSEQLSALRYHLLNDFIESNPPLRELLLNFHVELHGGASGIGQFLRNENLRYEIGRKERGWASYEEYREMKRKENE